MSKSKAAVALGRLRAAKLTPDDRSANARTGWRRRLGTDHVTADQKQILARVQYADSSSAAMKRDAEGRLTPRGNRVSLAVMALVAAERIVVTGRIGADQVMYIKGPKYPHTKMPK